MKTYVKPLMRALEDDAGSCGCNFHFNETPSDCRTPILPPTSGGPCVSVDAGQVQPGQEITLAPIRSNTVVHAEDGGASVTPLANTGIPGTQPINFGIPVGTRGVYADYALNRGGYATAGPDVGLVVGGQSLSIHTGQVAGVVLPALLP